MSQEPRQPSRHDVETSAGASKQAPHPHRSLDDFAATASVVPETVAKYRIIRMIGQGGMGAVYLAEQENPRRTVALKVIKPGQVSRGLLRRFELEAQVLGRLQHPGIAQIFEAGTFDMGHGAQPYFAMEFVEGRPLSELVLERGGSMRERLELISRIADAVQHAHQKGVIHRDLKPANILVVNGPKPDGDSVAVLTPKILDFGVARATDSDIQAATMQTDIGQIVGTLPYMSPEQVAGDPNELDTRADVYALGVIAYELLSGKLPHDLQQKTIAHAARIIAETDVTSLGTLDRTFRGDVETIVGKALAKDKDVRYQSAADLASDIRRYLHDEPISARPPSTMYQFRKFAKRNKAFVIGVAAVFVILIAAVAVSNYGLAQARQQRNAALKAEGEANEARIAAELQKTFAEQQRAAALKAEGEANSARISAETEARKTQAINNFLVKDMLGSANPSVAQGKVITVEMVLDEAVKKVGDAFKDQPELEASIRNTLAETYLGLGQYKQSLEQSQTSHALLVKALGPENENTLNEVVNIAVAQNNLGQIEESIKTLTDALPAMERVIGADKRVTLIAKQVLASSYSDLGKYDQAEPLLKSVMDVQIKQLGEDDDDTQVSISNYAYLLSAIGRSAEAEVLYRKIFESRKRVLGDLHPRTITAMANLAVTLHELDKTREAEDLFRQVYASSLKVYGPDHRGTFDAIGNLAGFLSSEGRVDEAVDLTRQAVEGHHRVMGDEHPDTISSDAELVALLRLQHKYDEASALGLKTLQTSRRVLGDDHPQTLSLLNAMVAVYFNSGDLVRAEDFARQTLAARIRVLGEDHPNTAVSRHNLGAILAKLKKYDEAEPYILGALETNTKVLGREHREVAKNLQELGLLREDQGRLEEALTAMQETLAIRRKALDERNPDLDRAMGENVRLLVVLKRFDQAEPLAVERYQLDGRVFGPDDSKTRDAAKALVELYEQWNKPEKAEPYRTATTKP